MGLETSGGNDIPAITDQERLSALLQLSFPEKVRFLMNRFKEDPGEFMELLRGRWFILLGKFSEAQYPRVAAHTIINNAGSIKLGKANRLEGCEIAVLPGGCLTVGDLTTIGSGVKINVGRSDVRIGPYSSISWGIDIIAEGFHEVEYPDGKKTPQGKPVEIGEHVWIGTGAIILPGARIGADSVVAAGSVVGNGEYPPNSLIRGNPASVSSPITTWRR